MNTPPCGAPHHLYPDTLCTEPAGHYRRDRDPHAGPLIVGGRERGGAAWDEPKERRMSDRHTADTITDDALDALYEQLDAAEESEAQQQLATVREAFAAATTRAARAEAALDRVRALHPQEGDYCAVCTEDFGRLSAPWPCPTIRALDGKQPAPAPAATEATADACCGKPPGAVCVHDVATPDQPKEQRERPTHPDGTPYRYHEINAEGWEHCDGCGLWGQWTVANPHECANDRVQPADQPKEQ